MIGRFPAAVNLEPSGRTRRVTQSRFPTRLCPCPKSKLVLPEGVALTETVTDPTSAPPFALSGRVVTMNAAGDVLDRGAVYGQGGSIVDVRPAADKPPPGFEHVPRVATRGTLFPGLIELHNHLPYDVLGLWQVPKAFENRDQWSGTSTPDYHRLITGPMGVLGADPALVAAVVRYVEVRCLLGGTTTSQG